MAMRERSDTVKGEKYGYKDAVRAWLEPGMFSIPQARKRRPNHEFKQDECGQAAIYALSSSDHGSAGETELSWEKQQRDLPLGVWTHWCTEKAVKGSLNHPPTISHDGT